MDFTREPIIESVVTPKEGCKLVVRSSKGSSQEEFFVDSVEVVSFGNSFFFRSLERPKSFLVPVSDYELLEVRETRLVLKNVGLERTIKIGGGREAKKEKERAKPVAEEAEAPSGKGEKKKKERKNSRRRRGKAVEDEAPQSETSPAEENVEVESRELAPSSSALLAPPSTLISDTIARYKDNALFKDAFFLKDEDEMEMEGEPAQQEPPEEFPAVDLPQSEFGSFEMTEEEEEEIYRQRSKQMEEEVSEVVEEAHEELVEASELPPIVEEEKELSDEPAEKNGNFSS